MTKDAPLHEFISIDAYLTAAQEILRGGHMPDLAGLDERIERLCNQVTQMEKEALPEHLAQLKNLLEKLAQCEADIQACHAQRSKAAT